MNTVRSLLWSSCALVVLTSLPGVAGAQEQQMLQDLRGKWKFQIGDDQRWSDPAFDDKKWDEIFVPSAWEDEGYPGYDGYAWYRKRFDVRDEWRENVLSLHMGTIDDADEVYVNGHFIGFGGQFPPHYISEYGWTREYFLPEWCLRFGSSNVIAVRVYDGGRSGGITGGKIGVYRQTDPLLATQSLAGNWKIRTGDDLAWKEPGLDDSSWREAAVPIYWETQGLKDYDGFAWYRFRFRPSSSLDGARVILLMGKIDDIDETYVNGERVGRTGTMGSRNEKIINSREYAALRAYTVPDGLLKFGQDNVIAVRVYDAWLHGGIYSGPVGLISRDAYMEWKHRHRDRKNPWDFFKEFFQ
ncbi:MAG TPA: beta galactosidase jelly roll domain-containing protein [Bacteroidota bacterium]|nr:beta galactosidase jelly roll domain-containing protein [Bacteroidota bacterium]